MFLNNPTTTYVADTVSTSTEVTALLLFALPLLASFLFDSTCENCGLHLHKLPSQVSPEDSRIMNQLCFVPPIVSHTNWESYLLPLHDYFHSSQCKHTLLQVDCLRILRGLVFPAKRKNPAMQNIFSIYAAHELTTLQSFKTYSLYHHHSSSEPCT